MVNVKRGYYRDVGGEDVGGDVYHFFMAEEPPDGQYIFRGGAWVPLVNGYYLMDRLITGDVDVDGPFDDPPKGVPPCVLAA